MTKTLSELSGIADQLDELVQATGSTSDLDYLGRLANGRMVATDCADFIREHGPALAALARRVEGAKERTVVQDREGFLYVGAMAAGVQFGERVALVPVEAPPSTEGGEDG